LVAVAIVIERLVVCRRHITIEPDFKAKSLQKSFESFKQTVASCLAQAQQEAEVDLIMVSLDAVVAQDAIIGSE